MPFPASSRNEPAEQQLRPRIPHRLPDPGFRVALHIFGVSVSERLHEMGNRPHYYRRGMPKLSWQGTFGLGPFGSQ